MLSHRSFPADNPLHRSSPLVSKISKKRYYILLVSREPNGSLNKVPIPLHYAYLFAAVAVVGLFTITGLTGSYSRMLIKTARFNDLRRDHINLQNDYAHLPRRRTNVTSRPPASVRSQPRFPRSTA